MSSTLGFKMRMNRNYTEGALTTLFYARNKINPSDTDINPAWGGVGIVFRVPVPCISRHGWVSNGDWQSTHNLYVPDDEDSDAQTLDVYTVTLYVINTEQGPKLYFGDAENGFVYVIHTIYNRDGDDEQHGITLSLAQVTGEEPPNYFTIVQHLHTLWDSDDVEALLSTYFAMKDMQEFEIRSLTPKRVTP